MTTLRELITLLDDVADVDWRDPSWWGFAAGSLLLDRVARAESPDDDDPYTQFLAANGGPRADTFMARDRARLPTPAERVARGVVRARVAAAEIARLHGTLPGQPLAGTLAWERGWLRARRLDDVARAAFVTPRGVFLARLDGDARDLARALGEVLAGRAVRAPLSRVDGDGPTPAAIAVALADQPLAFARHLHRGAWTRGGGPWLGLGDSEAHELVTTCHLAVDGFGHGLLSRAVFAAQHGDDDALVAAAAAGLGDAVPALPPAPPPVDAEALGFAGAVVPGRQAAFARAAYGLGRAVERSFPSPAGARRSASFQIPVAPGAADDPDRRRRRVRFALLALHRDRGGVEAFADFSVRLSTAVARERDGGGVLTRLLGATTRAPVPDWLRRRLLAARATPHPFVPALATLRGRGSLCTLRYPAGERPLPPLYAASSPGLSASEHDPRGAIVITLVHHDDVCTASVCGTGLAGDHAGARAFLDTWREELERLDGAVG